MVALYKLSNDEEQISSQPTMIERGCQMLRLSAGAKVQAHNVEARVESFRGSAKHVNRCTRAFESVNENKDGMFHPIFLPATVSKKTNARLYLEDARLVSAMSAL